MGEQNIGNHKCRPWGKQVNDGIIAEEIYVKYCHAIFAKVGSRLSKSITYFAVYLMYWPDPEKRLYPSPLVSKVYDELVYEAVIDEALLQRGIRADLRSSCLDRIQRFSKRSGYSL